MVPAISPGAYAQGFAHLRKPSPMATSIRRTTPFPCRAMAGDPLALYAALRAAGGAHGG
jgi:hypothetical protein